MIRALDHAVRPLGLELHYEYCKLKDEVKLTFPTTSGCAKSRLIRAQEPSRVATGCHGPTSKVWMYKKYTELRNFISDLPKYV